MSSISPRRRSPPESSWQTRQRRLGEACGGRGSNVNLKVLELSLDRQTPAIPFEHHDASLHRAFGHASSKGYLLRIAFGTASVVKRVKKLVDIAAQGPGRQQILSRRHAKP